MEMVRLQDKRFKRAVILSISVHLALFVMLIISPYLPKPGRGSMIQYVEVISLGGGGPGGGGGGGGGGAPPAKSESEIETAVPKRESLRDLTTPERLEQARPPAMTYPVEKPKRTPPTKPEKKAVIQKEQSGSKSGATPSGTTSSSGTGSGTGPRLGLGLGDGTGGYGFGEGYGTGGLSTFPYAYYIQEIRSRISANWETALIRSGVTGNDYVEVRFRIYRDGRTTEPEILSSSDNDAMKSSAVRAVFNASPFPPLPRGYGDEYLIVRLFFEHNR
jgi:TonB family protein